MLIEALLCLRSEVLASVIDTGNCTKGICLWSSEHTTWISHQWCPGCSEGWNESQVPKVKVIVKIPDFIREVLWVHNTLNFNIMDLKENISFVVGSLCYVLEKFSSKSSNSCFTVQALKFYPFIGYIRFYFWKFHMLLFTSNILFPKYQLLGRI